MRAFLASPTPAALLDIVFVPIFLIVMFLMCQVLDYMMVALIAVIVILALINKRAMARTTDSSTEKFREACDFAEAHWRQIESSLAMGYATSGEQRAAESNREAVKAQILSGATTGSITSIVKGVRQGSQILIIATATYLALEGRVTMGAIIASSILFSRALTPIDQLVGSWRLLFQTRGAWTRTRDLLAGLSDLSQRMELARPRGNVSLTEVVAAAPGSTEMILRGITFSLAAGESLGVIGASGCGKSTLGKVILGVWPTLRGNARLDGADVAKLDHDRAGPSLGYLPQSVELLPGTIAENIRRLGPDDRAGVIEAAQLAGAHELILALPEGYDSVIGKRGFALSGGQMQRIGLARALYGNPQLVLLDEPDADLDEGGEIGLVAAIASLRARGATLIVISHKPALIQPLDKLLVMSAGQVVKFGAMDEFANAARPVRMVK